MSKKTFKRIIERKTAEFRKWASMKNLTFKTTSEIEREKAAREKEQDRIKRQRNANSGGSRSNGKGQRKVR